MVEVKEYLTVSQACEQLSCCKKTLYDHLHRGLKSILIGGKRYVSRSDLDSFMRENYAPVSRIRPEDRAFFNKIRKGDA